MVETIGKIRLAARDGKGIRQITKDYNVSRNTVRKVLRSGQTRFEYHREAVYRPRLGPFIDTLTAFLKHDRQLFHFHAFGIAHARGRVEAALASHDAGEGEDSAFIRDGSAPEWGLDGSGSISRVLPDEGFRPGAWCLIANR